MNQSDIIRDRWPKGTLTTARMMAYRRLMDRGIISLAGKIVHYRDTQATVVAYRSEMPTDQLHLLLAQEARQ